MWRSRIERLGRRKTRELKAEIEELARLDRNWGDASDFGSNADIHRTQVEFAAAASAFVRRWSIRLRK